MKRADIIEVGTSDFRTLAGQVENGIFIEPIPYYFNRLPECIKKNVAISNYRGMTAAYYISEENIQKYGLPNWVRGCNSINVPHPTVKRLMKERGIPAQAMTTMAVEVVRMKDILDEFEVEEIGHLKIDTEGHDCVILNDFLDSSTVLPEKITFESNELSDPEDVKRMVGRLQDLGYKCQQVKFDMVCQR